MKRLRGGRADLTGWVGFDVVDDRDRDKIKST